MKNIFVKIEGIHCSHCESTIKSTLLKEKNIKEVKFDNYIACISYTGNIDRNRIINIIKDLDYYTKDEYISDDIELLKDNFKLKEFITLVIFIISIAIYIYQIFGFNIFNIIPTIDSNVTYGMLFITGLLTSIHCISMCGAINLVASQSNYNDLKRPIFYNIGRIISYTIIGGLVGLIGSVISINSIITGIIIIIASLIMFLMSLNMLGILKLKSLNYNYKTKARNPFLIGILNGLMPCGPLQAMQVYALSTGSMFKGALSMFLFSLGTVPLMLCAGIVLNLVKGKKKIIINKISSILILLLSLVMLNRGLLALDIDIFKSFNNYDNFTKAIIKDEYQEIEFDLSYNSYEDIIIQVDIPVRIIIHVSDKYLTGCNNRIIINEYGIDQTLEVGDNIIEFIPAEEKTVTYTCWMNMIKNTIKIVDDKDYFGGE